VIRSVRSPRSAKGICRRRAVGQLVRIVGGLAGLPKLRLPELSLGPNAESRDVSSAASLLDRIGINVAVKELNSSTLDLITRHGFRWIRTDLSWQAAEPSAGGFDFEGLRRGLRAASDRGLKVLGILDYGHPFYTKMLAPRGAVERRAFVRFCTEAGRQLDTIVAAWEVWNEPNHPKFWPPAPDAGEFIALLSEVAAALWKQSADASLVTGGLSTIDDRFLSALVPALDSLAKHGSLGLGLHPYRNTPPESVVSDLERVGLLREDGRAATPGGVRVWLTEWGYCRGTRGVGPLHQAEWVPRIPLVGAALDVPLTVLYTLRDNGPQDVAAYTCGFLSAHDEPYPVDDAWTAVSDVAESITSPFRVVPRGVDGTWTIGSCDSALVWPAAPTGVSGSKALTCGQGMSTCPTGIWVVKPATAYWARLGVQCP